VLAAGARNARAPVCRDHKHNPADISYHRVRFDPSFPVLAVCRRARPSATVETPSRTAAATPGYHHGSALRTSPITMPMTSPSNVRLAAIAQRLLSRAPGRIYQACQPMQPTANTALTGITMCVLHSLTIRPGDPRWRGSRAARRLGGACPRDVRAFIWSIRVAHRAAVKEPAVLAYRLGSDRGSPNHGSTLASKRVMAQIRSPARVSTWKPVAWRMPAGPRR